MRQLIGGLTFVVLGFSLGQANAGTDVSLKQLLEQGFEIRNVAIVPADIATRTANKTQVDGAVITLQKGPAFAVCNYTLNSYLNADWTGSCLQGQ